MLAADVGRIYYQSTLSHAAAASVAVAVSASMISSINCRHSVDMPARRAPRLGPVVTMLDGGGTIEVIRGRGMQFALPTLKSTNRHTPETYKWTVLDSCRRSVGSRSAVDWSQLASVVDGWLNIAHETDRKHWVRTCQVSGRPSHINPLVSKGNYSDTSNNTKLAHWSLMGGLLQLVQRGGAWVCWGPAHSHPRCTKCNSPPINGQCTNHSIAMMVHCSAVLT